MYVSSCQAELITAALPRLQKFSDRVPISTGLPEQLYIMGSEGVFVDIVEADAVFSDCPKVG